MALLVAAVPGTAKDLLPGHPVVLESVEPYAPSIGMDDQPTPTYVGPALPPGVTVLDADQVENAASHFIIADATRWCTTTTFMQPAKPATHSFGAACSAIANAVEDGWERLQEIRSDPEGTLKEIVGEDPSPPPSPPIPGTQVPETPQVHLPAASGGGSSPASQTESTDEAPNQTLSEVLHAGGHIDAETMAATPDSISSEPAAIEESGDERVRVNYVTASLDAATPRATQHWSDDAWVGTSLVFLGALTVFRLPRMIRALRRLAPASLALLNRIQPHEILNNPVRAELMDLVRSNPGIHFSELARRLELSNGQAEHHIQALVDAEVVVRRDIGGYHCYFADETTADRLGAVVRALKSKGALALLAHVLQEPGTTLGRLRSEGIIHPGSIYYHVRRLDALGLVEVRPNGDKRLFPTDLGQQAFGLCAPP